MQIIAVISLVQSNNEVGLKNSQQEGYSKPSSKKILVNFNIGKRFFTNYSKFRILFIKINLYKIETEVVMLKPPSSKCLVKVIIKT